MLPKRASNKVLRGGGKKIIHKQNHNFPFSQTINEHNAGLGCESFNRLLHRFSPYFMLATPSSFVASIAVYHVTTKDIINIAAPTEKKKANFLTERNDYIMEKMRLHDVESERISR